MGHLEHIVISRLVCNNEVVPNKRRPSRQGHAVAAASCVTHVVKVLGARKYLMAADWTPRLSHGKQKARISCVSEPPKHESMHPFLLQLLPDG